MCVREDPGLFGISLFRQQPKPILHRMFVQVEVGRIYVFIDPTATLGKLQLRVNFTVTFLKGMFPFLS